MINVLGFIFESPLHFFGLWFLAVTILVPIAAMLGPKSTNINNYSGGRKIE